jgi:hypothetical protein
MTSDGRADCTHDRRCYTLVLVASAVPVQPPAVRGQEHRPVRALADGQVDRSRRARQHRQMRSRSDARIRDGLLRYRAGFPVLGAAGRTVAGEPCRS